MSLTFGIPPASRYHRLPTISETPTTLAASAVVAPAAISVQNRTRCSLRPTDGRPGELNFPRTAHVVLCCLVVPTADHLDQSVLRRPLESAQYTSWDYAQVIDDHKVLASVGSVGDAYDNAMAESFVDTFKTELIRDRVWRSRSQVELAVLEYVDWFNNRRLHESLGDIPPVEAEEIYHARRGAILGDPQVTVASPRASEALTTPRLETPSVETGVPGRDQPQSDAGRVAQNCSEDEPGPARTATSLSVDESSQLVSMALGSDHHQPMETN